MRRLTCSFSSLLVTSLLVFAAACGPSGGGGDDDDDTGNDCSGDEERCVGNLLQVCVDGTFETGEVCEGACNLDLGGCVQCDPLAGNTCSDDQTVVACNADGTFGSVVETCTNGTACSGGECSRDCTADGVDLIYVVDDSYRLLSFDPRKIGTGQDPFTLLGSLSCPASTTPVPGWLGGVTPFSMSVDREGFAWVLYASGQIFKVDINNNLACTNSGFVPQQGGWLLFGMGFVTDTAGGNTEQLYIGGGDPEATPGGLFGVVSPQLTPTTLGNLPNTGEYSPELTGTGNAELFGFFPGISTAFVQQLDKANGAAVGNQLAIPGGLGGGVGALVEAWAFAQWGGKFYLFVTTGDGLNSNSTVRTIDRQTGGYELVSQNLPYVIVGAGVSTCAPVDVE